MDSKQIKLLSLLAKKLKAEKRNKDEILKSFISAGILTKNGNYTKNYPGLRETEREANYST